MIVQDLYSVLGLQVDDKTWDAGAAAIKQLDGQLKKLAVDALLASTDVNKAMSVIGFPEGAKPDKAIEQTGSKLGGLARAAAGLFVFREAAGALKSWITDAAAAGAHADDMSQALGISAESVQELGYAAEVGGSSAEELTGALFKLNMNMGKVAEDGGTAKKAIKELGLSVDDVAGMTADQQLELFAGKLAGMEDGTKKARLAQELFGKSGAKLIPFLNNGAEGIARMRQEARDLGIVMSGQTAKELADFEDGVKKMGFAWSGIKTQVVAGLLPALTGLVEKFQEFIAENREVISSGLSAALTVAGWAMRALGAALTVVLTLISFFAENSEVLIGVLVGITWALRGQAKAALLAARSWLILNAPIIATVALIALIVAALIVLVKHWDEVKEGARITWEAIKSYASGAVDWLVQVPGMILDAFSSLGQGIIDAVVYAFDYVVEKAKGAASAIWSEIKDIPVIGRLASGTESLAEGLGGSVQSMIGAAGGSDSVVPAGGGGLSASFGDVRVDVAAAPGMDENKLAELAAQKAVEAQRAMLGQAFDTYKGGRR